MKNMPFSIKWEDDKGLIVLDQTTLPTETIHLNLKTVQEVFDAIAIMKIRGASALSIAGAYGVYIGIKDKVYSDSEELYNDIVVISDYIVTCRPTAVSLSVTLRRIKESAAQSKGKSVEELKKTVLDTCHLLWEESAKSDTLIGENALPLFKDGDTVITHCNTGIYASTGIGSAVAPIYLGKERGINLKVYADETRPLLQGARLTAHELKEAGVDVTLICDNMAGFLMQQGKIDAAIVGCDRIAANGDTVNKIGTYSLAVLAKYHNVPFYVTGILDDVDFSMEDGKEIPIEERIPEEVTEAFGKRTAPYDIKVYNPSFDITSNELITAIILDKGIVYPPFKENLLKLKTMKVSNK